MKKDIAFYKIFAAVAVGCLTLSSLSLLFIPLSEYFGGVPIVGILFWALMIAGYVLLFIARRSFKNNKSHRLSADREKRKKSLHIRKIAGVVSLALFAAIFILIVILILTKTDIAYLTYGVISADIFLLHITCLLNGKAFI